MDYIPAYMTELALLLTCTAFLKMATVFSALRYGLGLNDIVFGVVVIAASFVFALVVPTGHQLDSADKSFWQQAELHREFLERNSDSEVSLKLESIRSSLNQNGKANSEEDVGDGTASKATSIQSTLASFVLMELKEAFQLGFILLIPFVVIDLIVVNILAVLGVTQISAVLLSLPLKIGLFIGAGGWDLLIEKLLNSYGV